LKSNWKSGEFNQVNALFENQLRAEMEKLAKQKRDNLLRRLVLAQGFKVNDSFHRMIDQAGNSKLDQLVQQSKMRDLFAKLAHAQAKKRINVMNGLQIDALEARNDELRFRNVMNGLERKFIQNQ
jgi:hypothetical protein